MLGFFEASNSSDLNVTNHMLLIFKQALYNKRNCSIIPNIDYIKQKIRLAYQIEKNSYRERHFVQTPKEMGQNFREIVKFGRGGNWHTKYNCVCLWTLSGGFRAAHGLCLGSRESLGSLVTYFQYVGFVVIKLVGRGDLYMLSYLL